MKTLRNLIIVAIVLFASSCEDPLDSDLSVAQRLEGRWHVEEPELKSTDDWYYVDLYISSVDSNRILIDDFHALGVGTTVYADISGMRIIIPTQSVANDWLIRGSADISNDYNKLVWAYEVDEGSGFWTDVSATYTKADAY